MTDGSWFTCSAVFVTRIKGEEHLASLIEERLYLVFAVDGIQANQKAQHFAVIEEAKDFSMEYMGKPAKEEFVGIRKIIDVRPHVTKDAPSPDISLDGSELTYSYFTLQNQEDLQKFIDGEAVQVFYKE